MEMDRKDNKWNLIFCPRLHYRLMETLKTRFVSRRGGFYVETNRMERLATEREESGAKSLAPDVANDGMENLITWQDARHRVRGLPSGTVVKTP